MKRYTQRELRTSQTNGLQWQERTMYTIRVNVPNDKKWVKRFDDVSICANHTYAYATISEEDSRHYWLTVAVNYRLSVDFHDNTVILSIPNDRIAALEADSNNE